MALIGYFFYRGKGESIKARCDFRSELSFNLFQSNNKLDLNFFILLDVSLGDETRSDLSTRLVERKRLLVSWKSNRSHCIFKYNLICVYPNSYYIKFLLSTSNFLSISSLISRINSNPYFS